MKKRILSIALCLCMVLSLLPTIALADGTAAEYGDFSVITESGAAPSYADKTLTLGTGTYTITMKPNVSGTSDRIVVNASGATLNLNGINISAPQGAPNSSGMTALTVADGTILNVIADSSLTGGVPGPSNGGGGSGIEGNVTVKGTAKLTAKGGDCSNSTWMGGYGIKGSAFVSESVQLEAIGGNGNSTAQVNGGGGISGFLNVSGTATVFAVGKQVWIPFGGFFAGVQGVITIAEGLSVLESNDNSSYTPVTTTETHCTSLMPFLKVVAPPAKDLAVTTTVTGGYTYADGLLTFTKGGEYTIAMKTGITSTSDRIVVNASGATLNLNGINISAPQGAPNSPGMTALTVADGTILNVIADSSLTGGVPGPGNGGGGSGIEGNVTVKGTAKLTATGGSVNNELLKAGAGILGSVAVSGGVTLIAKIGAGNDSFGNAVSDSYGALGSFTIGEGLHGWGMTNEDGTGIQVPLEPQGCPAPYVIIAPIPHNHCVCGGELTVGDHSDHAAKLSYTAWSGGEILYTDNTASIYLTKDVTLTASLVVAEGKTLNICLNRHKLDANSGNFAVLEITGGGTVNLCDCQNSADAKLTGSTDGGVQLYGGSLNQYGGSITGNEAENGGGIVFGDSGNLNTSTFTMYGGSITENTAYFGGGILIQGKGTVVLQGGSITGNTAIVGGGIVYPTGSLTLSGNVNISENKALSANSNLALFYGEQFETEAVPKLTIAGELTNSTPIGISIFEVTMGADDDFVFTPKGGVFTSGTAVANSSYADKFVSENEGYDVAAEGVQLKLTNGSDDPLSPVIDYAPPTVNVTVSSDSGKANVSATVNGGTADVSVTDSQLKDVIDSGKITGRVCLDLSATGGISTVKIPAKVAKATAENGTATGLEILLPTGSVTLDKTAVIALPGGDMTLSVENISTSALNDAQKKVLGDRLASAIVVDVNVLINGVKQESLGGKLTISISYTPREGEDTSKITVWHLKADGTPELHKAVYANGRVSFETDHLSKYVLVSETNIFSDVKTSDYYYNAVQWAVSKGVTDGITSTAFVPDVVCTRAQAVTFLWRAMGSPKAEHKDVFTDVAEGTYYHDAVMWAVEKGITDGITPTSFEPDTRVTRAQAATLLWRAAGKPSVAHKDVFTDIAEGTYYYNAVLWAVSKSITDGVTTTTFVPDGGCTRAQTVTLLWRYLGK